MKKFTNEFKVGIFALLCIAGLFYISYRTGKLPIRQEGYRIYVTFNEVVGLEEKAPVMLNGLEVGKVEDVRVSYDDNKTEIVLTLWLEQQAKIRENPVVSIKTLGLMGEKYIQISSSAGNTFVAPGTTLTGKPFTDMDVIMDQALDISEEVEVLVGNVTNLTDEVKKLAKNLNYTVEGNQDKISQVITNLEATSKNMEELSGDLKQNPWKLLYKPKKK